MNLPKSSAHYGVKSLHLSLLLPKLPHISDELSQENQRRIWAQVSEVVEIALKFLEKWTKNEEKGKKGSDEGYRLTCMLVALIDKSVS